MADEIFDCFLSRGFLNEQIRYSNKCIQNCREGDMAFRDGFFYLSFDDIGEAGWICEWLRCLKAEICKLLAFLDGSANPNLSARKYRQTGKPKTDL